MDLPELPFEKVLSYLSLEDLLRSRAVSRSWYHQINSFKVHSLCYSSHPNEFIWAKSRLVSGVFAQNFISSIRFESFFDTFSQMILSNLKHLRLCDLVLYAGSEAQFAKILQSFDQLKELDLIPINRETIWPYGIELKLNLLMLNSIQLEKAEGMHLILNAPTLKTIKLLDCVLLRVDLVHGESVERLVTSTMKNVEVKNLKKLRCLCLESYGKRESTLLQSLDELKELHLDYGKRVSKLFVLKKRYGRTDLKIFMCGWLLSGPDDSSIATDPRGRNDDTLVRLTSNASRLADEIPIRDGLNYRQIEAVAPESRLSLLRRFVDLRQIAVDQPVEDIERFLDLLKQFEHIVGLAFCSLASPPQHLFDRLPEHCAVQRLSIQQRPSDVRFLFRMKHLIHLLLGWSIDGELIRTLIEELPVLNRFEFGYVNRRFAVDCAYRFVVRVEQQEEVIVPNLDAVIQYITYTAGFE